MSEGWGIPGPPLFMQRFQDRNWQGEVADVTRGAKLSDAKGVLATAWMSDF